MNLEELPPNYEEQDEHSESERGTYSGAGTPETPPSPGSPCPSCESSSSDSSQNSLILDTNVFLPIKSVQVIAETVGVDLDDESAAIISQSAINKLRHLTLLAYQFSRHCKSKGVRVSDFKKAEKILDSSFSLGYGFNHKLPEYLNVGDVCIEYEGPDIDLYSTINKSSINEIKVDTSVDPVLVSHYANYHDKLSKDFDENRLCPDFSQLLKNLNFNQGPPQDCNASKDYNSTELSNDPSFYSNLLQPTRLPLSTRSSTNTAPELTSSYPAASSNVSQKCNSEEEFLSHKSCENLDSVKSSSNKNLVSQNGETSQVFGTDAKLFFSKTDKNSEMEESDVIFSSVNVAKKVKIESLDELSHIEDVGIVSSSQVDDCMTVKFEPMDIENESILFEQNGLIKSESDILPHRSNFGSLGQPTECADISNGGRGQMERKPGREALKKETPSNSEVLHVVHKPHRAHKELSPRSLQKERDIYTRGDFLRHQDVLGDQIFSEDTMSNDSVDQDDFISNEGQNPETPLVEDIAEEEDTVMGNNFQDNSESCTEIEEPGIVLKIIESEDFVGVIHTAEVSPPRIVSESTETIEVAELTDQQEETQEYDGMNGIEVIETGSQKEDTATNGNQNHYFTQVENVSVSESEGIEHGDRDHYDEDEIHEGDSDMIVSGYLPTEWAVYLQNFLIAFFDKEKSYETFEKISYSFYIDDEEEEELPIPDDFQVILKDVAQNGVFPILHIVCEFFHNFMAGKYNYAGSKQLKRITSFIDTTLSCPIHPKVFHLKPMLAILIDMLTSPVSCKLQSYVTKSIFKIADLSERPFNLELIRWITYFIMGVLESSSKLTLTQLTSCIKSRICAAIYLALEYDLRGLRLQRMHTWIKYVIMISNCHHVINQAPSDMETSERTKLDASDSYLEEAILRFIRVYVKNYHNGCPDNNFMPLLQCAMDNYGEKLSTQLHTADYFDVSTKDYINRQCKTRSQTVHSNESEDDIVTEFLVRPGLVCSKFNKPKKLKIPYVMCVL